MDEFLKNKDYCDIVILYNNSGKYVEFDNNSNHIEDNLNYDQQLEKYKYDAHRIVLATSKFFKDLFEKDANSKYYTVNLPDTINITTFRKMLDILYNYVINSFKNKDIYVNILDNVIIEEYIDVLKIAEYLIFDEEYVIEIFKKIIESMDDVIKKDDLEYINRLNQTILELDVSILPKKYKKFYKKLYMNNPNHRFNFFNRESYFDTERNTLIISSNILKQKLLGKGGKFEYDGYVYSIYTTYSHTEDEHGYWLDVHPENEIKEKIKITKEQYDKEKEKEILKKCNIRIILYNKNVCHIMNEKISTSKYVYFRNSEYNEYSQRKKYNSDNSDNLDNSDNSDNSESDDDTENKLHYIPTPIERDILSNTYSRSRYGIITNCDPNSCNFEFRIKFK